MTRIGFWLVMLAAFVSAGGYVGYVGEAATSADAPKAAAVEAITVYRINSPGYYVVQGGQIVPFGVQPPEPTPTPDPTLTERAKTIKAAAEKASSDPKREETATQLAELYRQIGAKITDKTITGQEMIQLAIKYGSDQLLTGKGTAVTTAWKQFRDELSSQVAKVLNAGGSDADFSKLLTEVTQGLQASAPNAEPQIDITMIMAIIKAILEILAILS